MFSLPTRSVAPAVFSRLQQDKLAMRTGFLSVAGLLSAVTMPICLCSAEPRSRWSGSCTARWVPAAAALAGLGMLSALRIGFELCYDYFVVLARSAGGADVQLVWLASLIPGLIVGTARRRHLRCGDRARRRWPDAWCCPAYLFSLGQGRDQGRRPSAADMAVGRGRRRRRRLAAIAAHVITADLTSLEIAADRRPRRIQRPRSPDAACGQRAQAAPAARAHGRCCLPSRPRPSGGRNASGDAQTARSSIRPARTAESQP